MIDRHQRRALSSGRHIGGAEIVNHRDADLVRQRGAVAELDRQLVVRPVQHGLAVESDDIDALPVDPVGIEKHLHGGGMQRRDDFLGLGDRRRSLGACTHPGGRLHGGPDNGLFVLIVEMDRARTEPCHPLAVGFDKGDIDAVHRRAAHQTDRPHPPSCRF